MGRAKVSTQKVYGQSKEGKKTLEFIGLKSQKVDVYNSLEGKATEKEGGGETTS